MCKNLTGSMRFLLKKKNTARVWGSRTCIIQREHQLVWGPGDLSCCRRYVSPGKGGAWTYAPGWCCSPAPEVVLRWSLAFRGRLSVVAAAVRRGSHFLFLRRVGARGEGKRKGEKGSASPLRAVDRGALSAGGRGR